MERGIIYYNSGNGCLIRMLVSLYSLRQVYDGNISIFYPSRDKETPFCIKVCEKAAEIFNCDLQEIDMGVPEGKNRVFLERTKYHTVTPYDVSMSIDSDTVVMDGRITDLFDAAEENEYALASFADWTTPKGVVAKRIKYWEAHHPQLVQPALDFGPAINCGCFAFRKDAELMQIWHDHAIVGRDSFICDETCMQILLPHCSHKILGSEYNTSCKYDPYINKDGYPVMIHFHGKKHCRFDENGKPLNNADIWLYFFDQCLSDEIFEKVGMDVPDEDYGDKQFRKNTQDIVRYLEL